MKGHSKNKSKETIKESIQTDLYSTSVIQDLLQSNNDWSNVEEIIKLTFKAFTDLIKIQSESLKEVKNVLASRASKTELTTGLSLKANVSDVSRTILQISNALESKLSSKDMQNVLKQYVTKNDIQHLMANKISIDDVKQLVLKPEKSQKVDTAILQARFDELQKQINKRLSNCVTLHQFQQVLTIIDQKANISEINEALQGKASKQIVNSAMQKKLSKNDLDLYLSKKADIADLEYIVNNLETKVDLSTIQKLTQVIQNKCDKSDINILIGSLNDKTDKAQFEMTLQAIDQLRIKTQKSINEFGIRLNQLEKQAIHKRKFEAINQSVLKVNEIISNKPSVSDVQHLISTAKYELFQELSRHKQILKQNLDQMNVKVKDHSQNKQMIFKQLSSQLHAWKRKQDKIYQQIDEVRRRAEQIYGKCIDKKEFIEFKSQIVTCLEEKLESEEVQTALNKWESAINIKIHEENQQILSKINSIEKSVSNNLSSISTEILQLTALISKKQDKNDYGGIQDIVKRNRKDIQEFRKTVDRIFTQTQNKLSIVEYQNDLLQLKKKLQSIQKDLTNKANIKDVCVLADSKPNIDQVNKALKQIHQAIDTKATDQDLKNIAKDQAAINQTLCSQNIVGRWLWNSGELKTGSLVPWQSESVNTLPDNFLWDKDKTSILTLASGMYQISVCFFSKLKPIISILINGEIVFIKSHFNQQKQPVNKKKKQKDSVGFKIHQFVMLPSRARVSIAYNGEYGAEGFLNIKRL